MPSALNLHHGRPDERSRVYQWSLISSALRRVGTCAALMFLASAPAVSSAPATWTLTGPMAQPRRDHMGTLLAGGQVLILGGNSNTAELFDPVSGSFSLAASPLAGHGSLATSTRLADGRVLIVGGTGAASTAEIYDPIMRVFVPTGGPHHSAIAHTATLLPDGTVLIAGGQTSGLPESQSTAALYDPATGVFTQTGSLLTPRSGHEATLLPNGTVLITGGVRTTSPGQGVSLSSAELYDPVTGSFSPTGNMNMLRAGHTATLLPDNTVLIAGGFLGTTATSAEIYDVTRRTFRFTGGMAHPRTAHTAALLPNGHVLVAGGVIAIGPVTTDSAELYDPATETFQPTSSMNVARQQHTATSLLTGQALITGGTRGGADLNSAELFDGPGTGSAAPPVVTVPPNMTAEATGPAGAVVVYTATAVDGAGRVLVPTCDHPSGSTCALGTTRVTCTATDAAGRSGSSSFSIIVADTTPPAVVLPGPITVDATSTAGARVSFTATATDIVDGPVQVFCSPASGSTFPRGLTVVRCVAADEHGNMTRGAFTVRVMGAVELLDALILATRGIGPGTSLQSKVQNARVATAAGKTGAACAMLRAFLSEVAAQRGKKLSPATANDLGAAVSRIRAALGC